MWYLGHVQALRASVYHSNSSLPHSKGIIQASREKAQEGWGADTLSSSQEKDGVYGNDTQGLLSCGDGGFPIPPAIPIQQEAGP